MKNTGTLKVSLPTEREVVIDARLRRSAPPGL